VSFHHRHLPTIRSALGDGIRTRTQPSPNPTAQKQPPGTPPGACDSHTCAPLPPSRPALPAALTGCSPVDFRLSCCWEETGGHLVFPPGTWRVFMIGVQWPQ
jgi:hypothetical protein